MHTKGAATYLCFFFFRFSIVVYAQNDKSTHTRERKKERESRRDHTRHSQAFIVSKQYLEISRVILNDIILIEILHQ